MLEACAASYAAPVPGSYFAPGVIEVAWVLGCERHAHIAALAAPFCRVEKAKGNGAAFPRGAADDAAVDEEDGALPHDGERLARRERRP